MSPFLKKIGVLLLYLVVVPAITYYVGIELIPTLEWRRVLATIGIFFGMNGFAPLMQTKKGIQTIQSLGI